jgi:Bardet-Biedl syndrome 9 protein
MSIFSTQEWWATKVGANEEFHNNSIDVGNVDNADPPANKIIVGSFSGLLRIFTP